MKDDSLSQHKDVCVEEGKDSQDERSSKLISSEIELMKSALAILERELMESEVSTDSDRSLLNRIKLIFESSPMAFKSMLQFVPGLIFLFLALPSQASISARAGITPVLKLICLAVATMDSVWGSKFLRSHAWELSTFDTSEVLESQSSHSFCAARQFEGNDKPKAEPAPKFLLRTSGASTQLPQKVVAQVDTGFMSFGAGKIPDMGTQQAHLLQIEQSIKNSQRSQFAAGPQTMARQDPIQNGQMHEIISLASTSSPYAFQEIVSTETNEIEEEKETNL